MMGCAWFSLYVQVLMYGKSTHEYMYNRAVGARLFHSFLFNANQQDIAMRVSLLRRHFRVRLAPAPFPQ